MQNCECGYQMSFWSVKCKACRTSRWRVHHYVLYGALLALAFAAVLFYIESRPTRQSSPDTDEIKVPSKTPAM